MYTYFKTNQTLYLTDYTIKRKPSNIVCSGPPSLNRALQVPIYSNFFSLKMFFNIELNNRILINNRYNLKRNYKDSDFIALKVTEIYALYVL